MLFVAVVLFFEIGFLPSVGQVGPELSPFVQLLK